MAGLSPMERKVIETFRRRVHESFPDEVRAVRLFGSKARGDAREDSDIDLLVVTASRD